MTQITAPMCGMSQVRSSSIHYFLSEATLYSTISLSYNLCLLTPHWHTLISYVDSDRLTPLKKLNKVVTIRFFLSAVITKSLVDLEVRYETSFVPEFKRLLKLNLKNLNYLVF